VRRAPIRRGRPLRPGAGPPRRRAPLERRTLAPASAPQRDAVRDVPCIVCGARTSIDPAHLVPRTMGGCDHALCVVALCRTHHRAYDRGRLDLVAFLEPRYRARVTHAVAQLGLVGARADSH
jgi:hypothetical protein